MSVNNAGQAWQMVTCSCCSRHFRCTPQDDYYNATTLEDGVCERCLLKNAGLTRMITIHEDAT